MPNNCRVVATANVDELMRSSIYQQMKKNPPNAENGQWDGFDPGVGIAPSNISRFTWAWGGPLDDADAVAIIRLKKAASAADIKTNTKVEAHKRDFQFREVAVGSIAVFEETYRSAFRDAKAERLHGLAFCVPESTLVVVCTKLEVLKEILQRGKPPQLSEGMHDAMNEANCSKTMAMAFSVKGLPRTRLLDCVTAVAGNAFFGGLPSRTDLSAFTEDVVGLAADISLDSSQPTLIATLLCKDAEHAANAKRMLDSARANDAQRHERAPRSVQRGRSHGWLPRVGPQRGEGPRQFAGQLRNPRQAGGVAQGYSPRHDGDPCLAGWFRSNSARRR